MTRWVVDATEPDDAEVSALLAGDGTVRAATLAATEPGDDEVEALIRRASMPAPGGWRVGPALLIAATVVLAVEAPVGEPSPAAAPEVAFAASGGGWTVAQRGADGVVVEQTDGVVTYTVDPVPAGQHLVVSAGPIDVEVVGTVFDVGLGRDDVWVSVRSGTVRVHHPRGVATVTAGERWALGVRADPLPVAVVVAPRAPAPAPALAPAPPPGGDAGPPGRRLASLLERVDQGERTADLADALAAFAAADPGSPLAADAEAMELEVAAAVREPAAALAALDTWLAAHPDHPRRASLLEVRADLARDRLHDCATAVPTYRELARIAVGDRRAQAYAWMGLCAAGEGNRTEAIGALRRALAAGLGGSLRAEVEAALGELTE